MGSWVKYHKKLVDNGLLRHPNANAVFSWLLLKADTRPRIADTKFGRIPLQPGEVVAGRKYLAEKLSQTEQNIRTALKYLSKAKTITIKSTSDYSIITIVNYTKYQADDRKPTNETTKDQPSPNQGLTTVKDLKKEVPSPAKAVANKDFMEVFCTAWANRAKGTKYIVTARDGQRMKILLQAGLELERWRLAVPAYLNSTDTWIKSQGFPMWALCDNFNLYGAPQPTPHKKDAL